MNNQDLPYRPNVCLVILNQNNQIFIGERNHNEADHWQLPQGGIEPEGTIAENALREGAEELGVDLDSLTVIKQLEASHCYDFRNPPEYAIGKFRGQEQCFWLLKFNGRDGDIQLDRYEAEFKDWKWCSVEKLLDSTDPIRHDGYKQFIVEVESYIQSSKVINQ